MHIYGDMGVTECDFYLTLYQHHRHRGPGGAHQSLMTLWWDMECVRERRAMEQTFEGYVLVVGTATPLPL